MSDPDVRANVIIGCLKDTAREWFGSLTAGEVDDSSEDSILTAIEGRFGKSRMQKLRIFDALK